MKKQFVSAIDESLKETKRYEGLEDERRQEVLAETLDSIHRPDLKLEFYADKVSGAFKDQEIANKPKGEKPKKLGFKDAKSTLIAAGTMAAVGAMVGMTGGEKKQPEQDGVENEAPKKSSWFTPRKIIAGSL